MAKDDSFSWQDSIAETWLEFADQVIGSVPQLPGAAAVLLAGWIIAQLLRVSCPFSASPPCSPACW